MADRRMVGVRYCGGCNPRYDRVAAVRALAVRFPGLRFVPAGPGLPFTLVVCGCSAQCADVSDLDGKLLRLYGPEQLESAAQSLSEQ